MEQATELTPKQLKRREKNRRRYERHKARKEAARLELLKHLPQPTEHALARWVERFREDEKFSICYARSRPVSWEELCAVVRRNGLRWRLRPGGEFRQDAQTGAVFAIGGTPPECRTVVRIKL